MATANLTELLKRFWFHISLRHRLQLKLLLLLMLLASLSEVLSIGAVLPFLAVLAAPERTFELVAVKPLILAFNITEHKQLLFPLTVIFVLTIMLAGALRLLLLWANTRISFAVGSDISNSIYRRTLYQPYAIHCARNSSEIISSISTKADSVIYGIIVPFLTLISSSIILLVILIALVAVNATIALSAFGGFGLIYALIIRITGEKLRINSQINARESIQVIKSLQEGLGGIRDVLIDGNQDTFCDIYSKADSSLRRSQGSSMFISNSPRYAMEALGMILIATLAYSLTQQADGITKAIPILGALALGAQRLLPLLQQIYSSLTSIRGNYSALQDLLALLDQPLPKYVNMSDVRPIVFNHSISLEQLNFQYDLQAPYVLKKISFTIAKGSRVGFIGATGSGKSTMIDIIMGLLQPSDGTLKIDGQLISSANNLAWQARVAHVPQTIFLADSSIEENIAFGVPKNKIDFQRVREASKQAQIAESIESWPMQYQTFVGERGVRLSGGQRQRIGIARALYKQADVIIFDEATSALDNKTEQAIMQTIEGLSKDITLIIVAHRLTTLKNCTQILELEGGSIKWVGNYQDLVLKNRLQVKHQ